MFFIFDSLCVCSPLLYRRLAGVWRCWLACMHVGRWLLRRDGGVSSSFFLKLLLLTLQIPTLNQGSPSFGVLVDHRLCFFPCAQRAG